MRTLMTSAVAVWCLCLAIPRLGAAQPNGGGPAPAPVPRGVAPPQPPPAGPVPQPATPVAQPAPVPAPAPAPQAPEAAPQAPEPRPEPSPPPPPAPPTAEPPPPPQYQPLGRAEAEIEPGAWDPWAHPYPGAYDHRGFYLRLSVGVGGAGVGGNNHVEPGVDDVTLTGVDLGFSFAVGGAIADNLILNADLFGGRVFEPQVDQDGRDLGDARRAGDELGVGERFELGGFGVGVTWYLMPINLYLAGSVGIGRVIFENEEGERGGSDIGFAANVMVGKEWWIAPEWGIGLAGQLILLRAHDDVLGRVGGLGVNLMFSATYN